MTSGEPGAWLMTVCLSLPSSPDTTQTVLRTETTASSLLEALHQNQVSQAHLGFGPCLSGGGRVGGGVQQWWGVAYRKENEVPGLSPPGGVCVMGNGGPPRRLEDSTLGAGSYMWHFVVTGPGRSV